MEEEAKKSLHMKGEMMFMSDWDLILFLASPVLNDVASLERAGLYINDLALHDFSRDLVFSSGQKSDSLKEALQMEEVKRSLAYVSRLYAVNLSIQGQDHPDAGVHDAP